MIDVTIFGWQAAETVLVLHFRQKNMTGRTNLSSRWFHCQVVYPVLSFLCCAWQYKI